MGREALRLGVDTGGTFTDLLLQRGRGLTRFKVPSTPDDPSRAIIAGLHHFFPEEIPAGLEIIHGTTVGTNAFLERKGARTLLVTTKGFEDILFIGRQNRRSLYDLAQQRPAPITTEDLIYGVQERMMADGSVRQPLGDSEIAKLITHIKKVQPEAVAICLLHSYANATHEKLLGERLASLDIPLILSSDILPEFREYERLSTTLINAYLSPIMSRYITRLAAYLADQKLSIQQSNGGLLPAAGIEQRAIQTILSGPAGGVQAAFYLARKLNLDRIITFDMGGTSTDVSLCHRQPSLTKEYVLDGYPVRIPVFDIHTVGAGGGSIARIDAGGLLHVGPESAGADPGPVCYGRGSEITVTDANLFLGRLLAGQFLGGRMRLDQQRTEAAMAELAGRLDMSPAECALGILRVVTAGMVKAVRAVSLERGHDPKEFTLFSFGGASGLHCCELARELGIATIIVPARAGILSAQGMLCAEPLLDRVQAHFMCGDQITYDRLRPAIDELKAKVEEEMISMGLGDKAELTATIDLRYEGQSFEMTVPFEPDFLDIFHQDHQFAYGYSVPHGQVECVAIRAVARLQQDFNDFDSSLQHAAPAAAGTEPARQRVPVEFEHGRQEIPVHQRLNLLRGPTYSGPCLIIDDYTTILIPADFGFALDTLGNIVIRINSRLSGGGQA